ncbi:MAG: ABC transporter permease [Solirubrobacteraceae bacterium]|nr:ABC transporter permease [Patulibacter sp.]
MSTQTLAANPALAAGDVATKHRVPAIVRHSLLLAQRSLMKTFRTPEALIDVTIQPAIFLVLFTYVFGGAISHGSQHDYLQYLLPGILGQTIALGGIAIGVNLSEDVDKGIFDRFRALPIGRSVPLIGAVAADVFRYASVFIVTMVMGYILGFRASGSVLDILAAGVLAAAFALCLSWASVWVGMKARTPGAVQGIMMLILFPLSFASSTFASPTTMPSWLRTFSENNPLTHLVDAERSLLTGAPMGDHLWQTGLWMVGLVAVFFPLALRAYRKKV